MKNPESHTARRVLAERDALRAALLGMVKHFAFKVGVGQAADVYSSDLPPLVDAFRALNLPNPCPLSEWPER